MTNMAEKVSTGPRVTPIPADEGIDIPETLKDTMTSMPFLAFHTLSSEIRKKCSENFSEVVILSKIFLTVSKKNRLTGAGNI